MSEWHRNRRQPEYVWGLHVTGLYSCPRVEGEEYQQRCPMDSRDADYAGIQQAKGVHSPKPCSGELREICLRRHLPRLTIRQQCLGR